MKRILQIGLWLGFLFAGLAVAKEEDSFRWYNANEGFRKAASGEKLMMVGVYATWCRWCERQDRQVFSREDIRRYLALKFIPIKLNAEDTGSRLTIVGHDLSFAELAQVYNVSGFPTVLFLEPDGTLLYKMPGFHPPDRFMEVLRFFGEREFEEDSVDKEG